MNRLDDMLQKINEVNSSNKCTWYDDKGKFKHYVLGRHILEHCHVKRLGGVLHIYDDSKRIICK